MDERDSYDAEAELLVINDTRRLVLGEINRAKREGVKMLTVIPSYG